MPIAVRNTLNRSAFDVKQKNIPLSTKKHFTIRKENFFKANSKVEMAKGYDLPLMRATVGFISSNLAYNNRSVQELDQQEHGGAIGKRTLIPSDGGRTGNSIDTMVRADARVGRIVKRLIIAKAGGNEREKRNYFMRAVMKAGRGGYVVGNNKIKMVYRIDALNRKEGFASLKKRAIQSYLSGRKVKIKATSFMKEASDMAAKNINAVYQEQAMRFIK